MTQVKITITRTRRGLGFPDTQRYVKRAAAAALRAEGVTVPCELDVTRAARRRPGDGRAVVSDE